MALMDRDEAPPVPTAIRQPQSPIVLQKHPRSSPQFRSAIEWVFDFTNRDGHRTRMEEIALLKGLRPALLHDPVANLVKRQSHPLAEGRVCLRLLSYSPPAECLTLESRSQRERKSY